MSGLGWPSQMRFADPWYLLLLLALPLAFAERPMGWKAVIKAGSCFHKSFWQGSSAEAGHSLCRNNYSS